MELQENLSNFGYYIENDFHSNSQSLKVSSPETPLNWKLLIIGIVSAKGIRKNVADIQEGGSVPVTPTPPVFRVVLLHTVGGSSIQTHHRPSGYSKSHGQGL